MRNASSQRPSCRCRGGTSADLWAVAPYDEHAYGLQSDEDGEDEYEYGYGYDEEDAFYDEEERREFSEFGITNADVEEMWEYGIKPWEDDAYVRTTAILWDIRVCC